MTAACYVAGRILGVGSRPLVLFLVLNYAPAVTAEAIAVGFLLASLALMGIGADSYRPLYAQRFGPRRVVEERVFHEYVGSLAIVSAVGVAFVAAGAQLSLGSLALAAACVLYFVSEKLQDEVLRYRLFERNFGGWGRTVVARTVLQFAFVGLLFALTRGSMPPELAITGLALANLMVFVPQLPLARLRHMGTVGGRRLADVLRTSASGLVRARLYWVLMVATAGVGYVDRLIAFFVDTSVLPLLALVVMSFTIVQMSLDFFYISRRRRDFLEGTITPGAAAKDGVFHASLWGGLVASAVAVGAVLAFARDGASFPMLHVLLIAVIQTAVSVAGIPREISYWKHTAGRLLVVEASFWSLFLAGSALVAWRGTTIGGLLAVAAACSVARLAFHGWLARRPATDDAHAPRAGGGSWTSGS